MSRVRVADRPLPLAGARRAGGLALFAVAAAVLLVAAARTIDSTPNVARITLVNPTRYQVNVEATGAERRGWTDLGAVGRERTQTFEAVADQGDRWVFRFSYAGVAAGEVTLGRGDLARQGWRLTVPAEVAERLRAANLPPSAP